MSLFDSFANFGQDGGDSASSGVDWSDPATYSSALNMAAGNITALKGAINGTPSASNQGVPNIADVSGNPNLSVTTPQGFFATWAKKLSLPVWSVITVAVLGGFLVIVLIWHFAKKLL